MAGMNSDLAEFVAQRGNVVTRVDVLLAFPHHVLDRAISGGDLVRVLPQVYVHQEQAGDEAVLDRAALLWAGPSAARSHSTGLRGWSLRVPHGAAGRHIVVPKSRRLRSAAGVSVHRRRDFVVAKDALTRAGLPIDRLERCLADWWDLAGEAAARAVRIDAVRQRLTTAHRVREAAAALPALTGRVRLLHLLELLDKGCQSELEIYGHLRVFRDGRLPAFRRQLPVQLPAGPAYLDVAFDEEMVNVELDGAAHHGSKEQRERDLRRDAALAALGWLVVRLSHDRLRRDPDGVLEELLVILAVRRQRRIDRRLRAA